MKFIEPSYMIVDESKLSLVEQVEAAGRTCYQSEQKEGDTSEAFFNRIVKRKHFAMTEFITLLFSVDDPEVFEMAEKAAYLNTSVSKVNTDKWVSGNLRAFNECLPGQYILNALTVKHPEYQYLFWSKCGNEPDISSNITWFDGNRLAVVMDNDDRLLHSYMTVRVICDRGVAHEIVRNRPFSFAQESTRYVRYGKEPMQFILPCWITDKEIRSRLLSYNWVNCPATADTDDMYIFTQFGSETPEGIYINSLCEAETAYTRLLRDMNWQPQQARAVLPNSLKTEIVIKGNLKQWRHFLYLRADKFAHPQMKEWTRPLLKELNSKESEMWQDIVDQINIID